ncbi:hypothetical protein PFICI_06484 [Pestalotiopsis fici W106-1]|uniref:Uncharacterized protein n=1 Tax=Pestalotiopsis fici (strain W106-1 / CGMCC3.15140) TaxID=1229662 RepID=W3X7V9_PESFW|nr:uncharacterized protein PFICI_06484 [Pestalotiopsis fici W106-1]ETS81482.1 hypothetical protein PFICI_06484 [Pestalotiopsis fici W106-1]
MPAALSKSLSQPAAADKGCRWLSRSTEGAHCDAHHGKPYSHLFIQMMAEISGDDSHQPESQQICCGETYMRAGAQPQTVRTTSPRLQPASSAPQPVITDICYENRTRLGVFSTVYK